MAFSEEFTLARDVIQQGVFKKGRPIE